MSRPGRGKHIPVTLDADSARSAHLRRMIASRGVVYALAIGVVSDMGLRLARIDLVLARPSDAPPKRCTVLEVNSARGSIRMSASPAGRAAASSVCRISCSRSIATLAGPG